MRRIAAVFAMVVGLGAIVAPSALADEYVCRGSVGARTVDNLKVPDGASCVLDGTIVQGTIKVETNATLRATGVQVDGNVQAEDAMLVVVRGRSKVGGSVQIVQGDAARVLRTRVIGDILYDENSRALKANYNRIGGNRQQAGQRHFDSCGEQQPCGDLFCERRIGRRARRGFGRRLPRRAVGSE